MRQSLIFAIIATALFSIGLTSYSAYADSTIEATSTNNFAIVHDNTQYTLSGLKSTDPQDFPLSYLWAQTAGEPVTISSYTAPEITFTTPVVAKGESKTLTFSLTVDNAHNGKSTTSFTLEVHHNSPPVVTTRHQLIVPELAHVTLTGSASDPDNDPLTLAWTQTSGDNVILSTPDQPTATFTAPAIGSGDTKTLSFTLTADDGQGGQASDNEQVIVMKLYPVTVSCSDIQKAMPGSSITLAPNVYNPYNATLNYVWKQGSGDRISGLETDKPILSFTVPEKIHGYELSFMFNVYEGPFLVANCESYIYFSYLGDYNVTAQFNPLREWTIANAGPDQTVPALSTVGLDGSKSVGTGLEYLWIQTAGEQVTLLNQNTPYPSFVAPAVAKGDEKTLEFTLTVVNGLGKDSDKVAITVINPADPPTARIFLK